MTNPLTEARSRVISALAPADLGVPIHPAPPPTLTAPCVVITPGTDWIVPGGRVGLEVIIYAPAVGGTAAALARLEETIAAVRDALYAAALAPGVTVAPNPSDTGQTLTAVIPVSFRTNCR